MTRPQLRRVLTVLLLALAVAWPTATPVADLAHAGEPALAASGPAAGEHDHGVRGTCPAVFCCVPPAVLPAPLPDHADAGRSVAFALASDRGAGRVPGVSPPPPKAPLLT